MSGRRRRKAIALGVACVAVVLVFGTLAAHTEPRPARVLLIRIRQEFHRSDHLCVRAHNAAQGTRRCRIILDGHVAVQYEVSDTGAVASCSAIA